MTASPEYADISEASALGAGSSTALTVATGLLVAASVLATQSGV